MFPPFSQEEAEEVCKKLADFLDDGTVRLLLSGKESRERSGNGIMLGALTGFLPDGRKCIIVTVSGISRYLEFSKDFYEKIKEDPLFKGADFYYAEPIVSQKEINAALDENDREIHVLTEKINALKESRRLKSGKYQNMGEEERELAQKRLSLTSESLKKVYSLYNFKTISGHTISLNQIMKGKAWTVIKNTDSGISSASDARQVFLSSEVKFTQDGTSATSPAFKTPETKLPPTGTGDCAAPKLLQKAFSLNLNIQSMAEIYYGKENANRTPLKTYPPCDERCGLILPSMLGLEILYRDRDIVVINKQSGLLSVPGRTSDKQDCVTSRLKKLFPECIEQPAVHRLDMETSGIMVLALTREAHRELNRQFENRETCKEYEALLDARVRPGTDGRANNCTLEQPLNCAESAGNSAETEHGTQKLPQEQDKTGFNSINSSGIPDHGTMELYFRVDLENRPHQIWDEVYGKKAVTEFIKIEKTKDEVYIAPDGETVPVIRMRFIPHTGRTHQLRLASADSHGLNHPIIGDTLYGSCKEGERLLLHATLLSFTHPVTKERMTFESRAPF